MEKLMGVYFIRNIINDKIYAGSSNNINRRWQKHRLLLNKNKHVNKHLQSSWNLYGEDKFKFELVEIVEDENKLIEREQYYINSKKSYIDTYGYNFGQAADTPNRGRHLSDEHREKISEANRGQIPWTAGKHLSEETKLKISVAHKGKNFGQIPWNKGKKLRPLSEEHKRKTSESMRGKKPYEMTDEIRRKISESKKGKPLSKKRKCSKPFSEEHRANIGIAKKGKKPYGMTDEIRKKMSESHMGQISKIKGKHFNKLTRHYE